MLFYGLILDIAFHIKPDYFLFGVVGLFGSVAAQLGDISMSIVKRNYGIKDYGTIMPGHGGVLDRFDSVLFAAPMIETLMYLLPPIFEIKNKIEKAQTYLLFMHIVL